MKLPSRLAAPRVGLYCWVFLRRRGQRAGSQLNRTPLCRIPMRHGSLIPLLLLFAPTVGHAQTPALADVFGGASLWHANAWMGGGHVGARVHLPGTFNQLAIAAVAFYGPARGDSTTPAITSVELELRLAFARVRRTAAPNLFLTFGIGRTHFDGQRQAAKLEPCFVTPGCMAEDVTYFRTATRRMYVPGLAVEIPVTRRAALVPHVRIAVPRPSEQAHAYVRFDMGAQWRL